MSKKMAAKSICCIMRSFCGAKMTKKADLAAQNRLNERRDKVLKVV
jgi:hypothetical protein